MNDHNDDMMIEEDIDNNDIDPSTMYQVIPQEIQFIIFTYLPALPYYFSLKSLNKYFASQLSSDEMTWSEINCLNLSPYNRYEKYIFQSPAKSIIDSHFVNKCKPEMIQKLVLSSLYRPYASHLIKMLPNLKELTYPSDFLPQVQWRYRLPVLDSSFSSELKLMASVYSHDQIETLNVFLQVPVGLRRRQMRSRDAMYGVVHPDDGDNDNEENNDNKSKEDEEAQRCERLKLIGTIVDALRSFPKLKRLNVYNTTVSDADVAKSLRQVQYWMRKKNEILDKIQSQEFTEARRLVGTVADYNRLCLHPTAMSEDFELNVYPCLRQQNKTLAFDDLIRCGLSPSTFVQDNQRSYLFMLLHYGNWARRKAPLEELYKKHPTEFFSWFRPSDWSLLLSGETCEATNFISFFLPKFTKSEFMHVVSPLILSDVGDNAYIVIQKFPEYGFDFKSVPNLLKTVEKAPRLYQYFCEQGCSLQEKAIVPQDYLKQLVQPCVLHKVLEESVSNGIDLANSKEFKDHIFNTISAGDEQFALIALDKIGVENVQTHRDNHGDTYLHAALAWTRLELARSIIRRYGIKDINMMNNSNETVLHIACRSMKCLPNLIELLLGVPGIKTYIKNKGNEYAYDIMVRTMTSRYYPLSLYANILKRLEPKEAMEVDKILVEASKIQNDTDQAYPAPRKRRRKSEVVSCYQRTKRAKDTTESNEAGNEAVNDAIEPTETICQITGRRTQRNSMSLRTSTKRFSSYAQ